MKIWLVVSVVIATGLSTAMADQLGADVDSTDLHYQIGGFSDYLADKWDKKVFKLCSPSDTDTYVHEETK